MERARVNRRPTIVSSVLLAAALLGLGGGRGWGAEGTSDPSPGTSAGEKPAVIVVLGAPGEEAFGEKFRTWGERWLAAARTGGATAIPIGFDQAWRQAFNAAYPTWIVGVNITYPIGHSTELAALSSAQVGSLTSTQVSGLNSTQIQALETPATDKDAPLPVHAGAAAFIDGEQKTFFERYGDWFYLGVMGLS
mgnify:CR=1 FL=1